MASLQRSKKLDATCVYIPTIISTIMCNIDTNIFGYIIQKDDRE